VIIRDKRANPALGRMRDADHGARAIAGHKSASAAGESDEKRRAGLRGGGVGGPVSGRHPLGRLRVAGG
jgi:hypothetical protein